MTFLKRHSEILILLAVLVLGAVILLPELRITRYDQNDNVLHWTLIQGMAAAKNPLDFWTPEIAFGQPIARLYQPGAHLLVVGLWNMLFRSVPLMDVFILVRFLSVALLPLSFFFCARLIGLTRLQAVSAAALSWLISGDTWGLDFGSYAWAGHGLFPQAVAAHFLLFSIGFGWQAIREKPRRWIIPALLLLCCGWTNLLYGYVGAVTLVIITLIPGKMVLRRSLILAKIGAIGAMGIAPKLISWWQDMPLMGGTLASVTSRAWMMNGLGAGAVLKQLIYGDTLDHGRLPVLTALALGGIGLLVMRRVKLPAEKLVLVGFLFWLQVSFGSAFWGPLIKLVGVTRFFQVHRLVGAVDLFLVLAGGIALAAGYQLMTRRFSPVVAILACACFLEPALQDRITRMNANAAAGELSLKGQEVYQPAILEVMELVRARGGRAYAGSFSRGVPAGWGNTASVGYVPMYAMLTTHGIANPGFMYIGLLDANFRVLDFDDQNPQSYVDANVKTVVSYPTWEPPAFLAHVKTISEFAIYSAPGKGYFDESTEERDTPDTYWAKLNRSTYGDALVRVPYHRNWHATVDGKPESIHLAANGFMKIWTPSGEHEVSLKYR